MLWLKEIDNKNNRKTEKTKRNIEEEIIPINATMQVTKKNLQKMELLVNKFMVQNAIFEFNLRKTYRESHKHYDKKVVRFK